MYVSYDIICLYYIYELHIRLYYILYLLYIIAVTLHYIILLYML